MMNLENLPPKGQKKQIKSVVFDALPLLLHQLAQQRPMLILTDNAQQAKQLCAAWAFFAPSVQTAYLPDWETLPYERLSPHRDLVSERLLTLWRIKNCLADVLILPVANAMQKLPPSEFILAHTFCLQRGQSCAIHTMRENLIGVGYEHVSHVVSAGEFAVRGSIVDLFPMGANQPYRIDFFDDEIDSIKTFDPESQRTKALVDAINLLPAHEFPTDKNAQTLFRQRFRELIEGDSSAALPYRAVSDGLFGGGIEYYLPLFFAQGCVQLCDYLPDETVVFNLTSLTEIATQVEEDIKMRFRLAGGDETYPPLSPQHLYCTASEFQASLKAYARVDIQAAPKTAPTGLPPVAVDRKKNQPLQSLMDFQAAFHGRILLCADSLGRRETMLLFFQQHGLKVSISESWADFLADDAPLCLVVAANIANGFRLPETALAVITESDLYPDVMRNHRPRRKHTAYADGALRDLAEIRVGDPVVHEEHGIGRYLGLINIDLGEGEEEMMLLEYADAGRLYVPVAQLHVISRYAGQAYDAVKLHHLGSGTWQKVKQKAIQKARDTAAELLNLYAQRAARKGHAFVMDEVHYQQFAGGFEYEETEEQAAAIVATIQDLLSEKPMDRLICGDVGFGKTEVALRAAFVAAMNGKQVAILAPTTLLVEQHAKVFAGRFADFPIKVAALSRMHASKESKATVQGLAEGTVDIVIGTHKLIQPNMQFKDLGLVVIDEEHRFGVRQKEELKRLRAHVDILTLTATPIPRTLSMALEGLRDFSLITTAPNRRLSVKTFVKPFGEGSIREAMLRELKRGGQVFFLHNEVDTIHNMYDRLHTLLPEARIGVAHGQMPPSELAQVMRQFLQQHFNVLLCSTIIETGIDIPNANTIIIHRADKFGIAQLHQLRGRVGRSHHQAYAYLLTPDYIGKDAQKRLDAIAMADELGAGFLLAMQDLEIRGAGEILGEGQSGEMMQVGMTLYGEMLKQAVYDLKNERIPDVDAPLGVSTEIKLHAPALLPESYCPDVHERLVLYKRLAACNDESDIHTIHEELIDRFGLPEEAVTTLLESHRLRLLAHALGIVKIDAQAEDITFGFGKNHTIDPVFLIELIQADRNYRFAGQDKLRVTIAAANIVERIVAVKTILARFATHVMQAN